MHIFLTDTAFTLITLIQFVEHLSNQRYKDTVVEVSIVQALNSVFIQKFTFLFIIN